MFLSSGLISMHIDAETVVALAVTHAGSLMTSVVQVAAVAVEGMAEVATVAEEVTMVAAATVDIKQL